MYLCCGGGYSEDPEGCGPRGVCGFLDPARRVLLSKRMAHALRHDPGRYGVRLDARGWASVEELVRGLKPLFPWLERWHVEAVALLDPKGRYELHGGRVRARYGHSVRVEVEPLPGGVPALLYHGTVEERLGSILRRGILPMGRVLVHLSGSVEDAVETGRRHGPRVVVLVVSRDCLVGRGLRPERKGRSVYTVERVPSECIIGVVRPG